MDYYDRHTCLPPQDQVFLILLGGMIFFMQVGFAFVEAGMLSKRRHDRHITEILMKNVLDSAMAALAWWACGFAFAFGKGNRFIGYSNFFLVDIPECQIAYFFFEYTFVNTASTIASGSMAERTTLFGYLTYTFFMNAFTFPVVIRWAWIGGGWLSDGRHDIGFEDFAGSFVVHAVGGLTAFVGANIVGPRVFRKDNKGLTDIRGSFSSSYITLGGFVLAFGFIAFNAGSAITFTNTMAPRAAQAAINSMLSGMTGAITVFLAGGSFRSAVTAIRRGQFGSSIRSSTHGSLQLSNAVNGLLIGNVAVCAGADVLAPWAAVVTGAIAGLLYHKFTKFVRWTLVDDAIEAVSVHFGGGLWGVFARQLFRSDGGILSDPTEHDSWLRVAWLLIGVVVVTAWTVGNSYFIFYTLHGLWHSEEHPTSWLRLDDSIQTRGLFKPYSVYSKDLQQWGPELTSVYRRLEELEAAASTGVGIDLHAQGLGSGGLTGPKFFGPDGRPIPAAEQPHVAALSDMHAGLHPMSHLATV